MVVVGLSKESANLELWDALQVTETDSFVLSVWLTHCVTNCLEHVTEYWKFNPLH
jgi:hypothetical protein